MTTAVLDVNVIVSALLAPRGAPRRVLAAWEAGLFSVASSDGIIAEVEDRLRDPRIGGAYGVTPEDVRWVADLLRTQAEIAAVASNPAVRVTSDPEDDYVLATALACKAEYLVTGDRRMLVLAEYEGTRIVSPREFLEILEQAAQ